MAVMICFRGGRRLDLLRATGVRDEGAVIHVTYPDGVRPHATLASFKATEILFAEVRNADGVITAIVGGSEPDPRAELDTLRDDLAAAQARVRAAAQSLRGTIEASRRHLVGAHETLRQANQHLSKLRH